jgi:L-ascorbate metabolism protein UlaG (beta-lactamase superfamily)
MESVRKINHPKGMTLMPAKREGKQFLNPVPAKVGGLSLMFKIGPRFFLGAAARSPRRPLGPFHTDHRVFATSPHSGLRITWMGHSTSLVEIDGIRLLIDPVWDERSAPTQWAGPKRFFPAPLALQDLPSIDAVVISHDHYDHLGAGTIRRLATMPQFRHARWITTLGVEKILHTLGVDAIRCTALNWTENLTVGSVAITALPARHFSGRSLFNRFETLWAGYLHRTEANIAVNNQVLVTLGSSKVHGLHGPGTGFLIEGTAAFLKEGAEYDAMKSKFGWARAVLSITVDSATQTI